MRNYGVALAMLAAMAAAGCAKNPDAIVAVNISAHAYSGLSCQQLAAEHQRSSQALAAVSQQQRQAATNDAVGVFLIGVPVSSISGNDKEGLVAQHKGEIIAIEGAMRAGQCTTSQSGPVAGAAISAPSGPRSVGAPSSGPVRVTQ